MIDIRILRNNPELVKQAMRSLGSDVDVDALIALDRRRRDGLTEVEQLKSLRNKTSEEISRLKKAGQDASDKIAEMRAVSDRIKALDEEIKSVEEELHARLLEVPNLPDPSVPVGPDESANVIIRTEGTLRQFDFEPKAHWDLGPALGIIDFERGVKMSGSRFYLLKGWGAKLQRAL
ncbi:MAG: serine--tRNA ligase, partial [Abditibacteriales bacterium]|nr:serine--tRNA ligase [Abditibacteriales bacterium]MDW8367940.1 serine--tRNA ligase [Abditibacteriales bacterium]